VNEFPNQGKKVLCYDSANEEVDSPKLKTVQTTELKNVAGLKKKVDEEEMTEP